MTLTIDLPSDLENRLRQEAARSGQDVGSFVVEAVKEKIAKGQTLAEICVPFAAASSGISDQEFDEFFEQAREEVWQERRGEAR